MYRVFILPAREVLTLRTPPGRKRSKGSEAMTGSRVRVISLKCYGSTLVSKTRSLGSTPSSGANWCREIGATSW